MRKLGGHNNATRAVAFSPGRCDLVPGGDDRTTKLWRVWDGALLTRVQVGSRVRAVAFSPNGQLLATGSGGSAQVWRVSDGTLVRTFAPAFGGIVPSVAFSPDGTRLAAGSLDGTLRVWLVSSGALKLTRTLRPADTNSSVTSVAFSPDGTTLVAGNDEACNRPEHGTLRFWRVSDGTLLHLFDQQTATYVSAVAFAPRGGVYAYTRATDGVVAVARNPS